jgi:hypothetical protein
MANHVADMDNIIATNNAEIYHSTVVICQLPDLQIFAVKQMIAVRLQMLSTTDSTYVVRRKNQSVMEITVVKKDTVLFLK